MLNASNQAPDSLAGSWIRRARPSLLIAFTAYLETAGRTGSDVTFDEWMAARPDVCTARDAISENPAGERSRIEGLLFT